MDSIEQYLQEGYIIEKNRIKEIEDLVNEVVKTFSLCGKIKLADGAMSDITGWPYEMTNLAIEVSNFSASTNSMILFVVRKFLDETSFNSPIIPCINWELDWKLVKRTSDQESVIVKGEEAAMMKQFYRTIYQTVFDSLITECRSKIADGKLMLHSGSFGVNDPFTLSWIAELIVNDTSNIFSEDIKELFVSACVDRMKKAFENPDGNILDFGEGGNSKRESSNHVFPLLRLIHLYKTFSDSKTLVSGERLAGAELERLAHSKLYCNLQNRVNQQISYSVLQNSLFDTAELIMSLEGLILIDDKKKIDEALLTKAFEILKINQKNNLNWRPLKPFVTSAQGDILLPLSIEIANSLLRICKHLEKNNKYYFHEYFEIFENYTNWLLANVSQCKIGETDYRGWCSEHVQKHDVIHPWETAQVVIYLMNYKCMIQDRIAYKSLKKSGLSCDTKYVRDEKIDGVDFWNKKWDAKDSVDGCYEEIRDDFIKARLNNKNPLFSMLLYGPPGTGKSSIAESLAEALNWRLITITPSDFIKYGEADIEGRAKSIFKTLEEQKDCVILFDEIDRMILDRDSNYYSNQGDFYQFMTPSMLVKIKDLRTKERSIFIIATNYEEKIDSAIKRSGRIDKKYLVNTLNKEQRALKIKKFWGEEELPAANLDLIVEQTSLYTFTELKTIVKRIKNSVGEGASFSDSVTTAIQENEPTIKLLNYKRRFQFEKEIKGENLIDVVSSVFPYREFFELLFLKLECQKVSDMEELLLIKNVFGLHGFYLKNYFKEDSCEYNAINDCYNAIKNGSDDKTESVAKKGN